jgi:TRAP-type mannitol/chloroaromatic compound transport system permease large subunit
LFAAMAGSSPATCSAIGSAGIPQMRKHGYSGGFAAGIIAAGGTLGILLPPSITMILYAVAAEQSLGRLFLAAIGPALLLVALFTAYAVWRFRWEFQQAKAAYEKSGTHSEILRVENLSMRDKFALLAACSSVRGAADRCDDRALRRVRHAVRNGGPWRGARARADRHHLQRVVADRS